jgi:protein disulfide-isomerase
MKKILVTLLLIVGSFGAEAQELVWERDVNKALEISQKSKKPLFMFFTGSDWCGWCIRLQKEVLKTPEFATWAKDNVVLVELDFPRKNTMSPEIQNQNNQLQQLFEVRGYPTVWIVNAEIKDGKTNFQKLGTTGYVAGGPEAWLAVANGILKNK